MGRLNWLGTLGNAQRRFSRAIFEPIYKNSDRPIIKRQPYSIPSNVITL
jgi:hypothetical protein